MDTRLKNIKITCAVSSIVFVIAGFVAYFEGVMLIGAFRINDTAAWLAELKLKGMEDDMSRLWGIVIVAGIICLASLAVALITVGKKLNWFDRIFTDIQIVAAGFAAFGAAAMSMIHADLIWKSEWFVRHRDNLIDALTKEQLNEYNENWWRPWDFVSHFEPRWVEVVFDIAATMFLLAFCLLVLLSIVKKIKAGSFWRYTIIGRIVCVIADGAKESENYYWKVMGTLIGGVILSATWIGAVPIIIVIVIFVPKMLKKYLSIRDGVRQVAAGNLDYKIPVTDNGELDRLAMDINSISEATSIAVANELKNQRMKTDLISNVSHDLKTPLTSMVSYVDLLKTEGLDSENAPQYLNIIDEKTRRLQKLTEDLFEAAKASSGAIPVNMDEIEMTSIISQALAELEDKLAENNLQMIYNNRAEDTRVMADGQLLWRVIENLLVNASKYALPGSRVYLDVTERSSGIVLEIKNISKDPLNISADELMERFKRGDESRNTEGSGLGLAIAKDLINLMDGYFEISIDGDLFKATVALNKASAMI